MIPKPLDQIGWKWADHKSALSWFGILYRHPHLFQERLGEVASYGKTTAVLMFFVHVVIYILGVCLLGRCVIGKLLTQFAGGIFGSSEWSLSFQVLTTAVGIGGGFILGALVGCAIGFVEGLAIGITCSLIWGAAMAGAAGITWGIFDMLKRIEIASSSDINAALAICGVCWGICFALAIETTFRSVSERGYRGAGDMFREIALEITVGLFFATVSGFVVEIGFSNGAGLAFGSAFSVATFILATRFYYLPLFFWLSWPKPLGYLYSIHPVVWDTLCLLPFPALSRLLVSYSHHNVEGCEQEIERIINAYPTQRKAALKARTILLIRSAAACTELNKLYPILSHLPVGKRGYLAQVPTAIKMVLEIEQIQANFNTTNLQTLREPKAQMLCEKIKNFHSQIAGFLEPLASELRNAATNWLAIAQQQLAQVRAMGNSEAVSQVFRAGDPANRSREAFVPRYTVIEALEKQILLATGCPGILLYGRRRMGKSTILGNLKGFLPETVIPAFISMQNPQAFTSLINLIQHIVQKISEAWPYERFDEASLTDLATLMGALSSYNSRLQESNKRVLLTIDEYENIDRKLAEKVFSIDLLDTIRDSIQTHRNITWLFSGSHDLTELRHAEWASYLVSARTIEVPMFTIAETELLLTQPLKFSPVYKDESTRPRFEPSFWGENGIERIHREAGGWPHLVQLIAETIVDLINNTTQRQVDDTLLESALNKAIVSGNSVFHQLLRGESTLPGEWDYLSAFRSRETQSLPGEEAIYVSLRRRLLMEEANGEWRLRVPLMARWLKQRG